MTILLTIVHVIACLLLILIVLLQSGKGADLAGAFGGGGIELRKNCLRSTGHAGDSRAASDGQFAQG